MKPVIFFAALVASATLSTAAFAQPVTNAPNKPISVRLGVLFLSSRTSRNFVGRTKGQLGASYAFSSVGKGRFLPRLDFDYFSSSHGSLLSGSERDHLSAYTLTINALVPLSQREGLNRGPYVGAGVGVARSHQRSPFPEEGAGNGPIVLGYPITSSKTGLAAKAFIGYNFTPNIFGEIGYNELPKVSFYNPSNTFVQLGARF